ncbi:MAG: PAS domain-containing protein, partial [Planctomycetota bacterium]
MRRKIFLSLSILLLLFAVGAMLHMLHMRSTTISLNHVVKLSQVDHLRQDLIMNIQTVQSNLYTARTPLAEDLNFVVNNVSTLDGAVKRCNACHHSPQIASRISEVQSLVEDYKTALSSYITASADVKRIERLKMDAAAIGNRLIGLTQKMTLDANEHLEQKTKAALLKVSRTKIFLLITVALTLFLAILISLHLVNAITRPVDELVKATRAVASGNLSYKMSYQDKTEFGELAGNFNDIIAALQYSYESIRNQQQKIKENEWKFRTLSEFAYDWESWITEKGEILFISPSCERITGYTRDEFIKDPDIRSRIVYPHDKDLWESHMADFKSPRYEEIEFRIVTKSGEIKWLSHVCAP